MFVVTLRTQWSPIKYKLRQREEYARSARLDCCAEDVRIQALVIAKLELVDVKMEILLADFMERANDPAFYDGPEPFDGVGMNGSADIFPLSMMHQAVRDRRIEFPIAAMIVRRKQAYPVRNGFVHEALQRSRVCALNYPSHDIPLALHRSDYNSLSRSACAPKAPASTSAFMLVLRLPAHIRFVYFDIANEFFKFDIAQRHADFSAHEPGSFVGTESHIAAHLQRTDSLLARKHQVNDAEPFAEGFVGVLEDRPDQDGKAIADATRRALVALPVIILRVWMHILIGAARTAHAFRPAILHQIFRAGRVIWEQALKIANRHLVDMESVFRFPHGLGSFQSGASMPC